MNSLERALMLEPKNPVWQASLEKMLASIGGAVSIHEILPEFNAPWIPSKYRERFCEEKFGIQAEFTFVDTATVLLPVEKKPGDTSTATTTTTKPPLWSIVAHGVTASFDGAKSKNAILDSETASVLLREQIEKLQTEAVASWAKATAIAKSQDAVTEISRAVLGNGDSASLNPAALGLTIQELDDAKFAVLAADATAKTLELAQEHLRCVTAGQWGEKRGSGLTSPIIAIGDCSSRARHGLIAHYLRGKKPEVRVAKTINDEDITEVCPFLSLFVESQLEMILRDWVEWVRSLPEDDVAELEAIYNRRFCGRSYPSFTGLGSRYNIRDTLHQAGVPFDCCFSRDHVPYMKDFQVDSAFRYAVSGGIIGFDMGLGKTYTAIMAIALRRYWGLIPGRVLIFVPATVFNDWRDSIKLLLPRARVGYLPPGAGAQRTEFLAEMIAADVEIILATKEAVTELPLSPTDIDLVYKGYQREMEEALESLPQGQKGKSKKGRYTSHAAKVLDSNIEALSAARAALKNQPAGSGIYFSDLNIGLLVVDEIQYFKNAILVSSYGSDISGLNSTKSQRSTAFELMIAVMRSRGISQPIIGLTGTPEPTNSIAGLYVMLRYLAPDELRRFGCQSFDSFLMTFCDVEARPEQKPDGSYKDVKRIRGFSRMKPELMLVYFGLLEYKLFHHVAHDFKDGDRPTAITRNIACKPSPLQEHLQELILRLYNMLTEIPIGGVMPSYKTYGKDSLGDLYPLGWPISKDLFDRFSQLGMAIGEKNFGLKDPPTEEQAKLIKEYRMILNRKPSLITPEVEEASYKWTPKLSFASYFGVYAMLRDIGTCSWLVDRATIAKNFAAVGDDFYLALNENEIHPDEKIPRCAREVAEIYDRISEPGKKATQLVVIDHITMPDMAMTTQEMLRDLILRNNPKIRSSEVQILSSKLSPTKRAEIKGKVKTGEVRILISSRELVGVGANIQDCLYAIHSLDVAWRPDIVQQLKGRIERQGNKAAGWYDGCYYFQYVTQGRDGRNGSDSVFIQILLNKIEANRALLSERSLSRDNVLDPSEELEDGLAALYEQATGDNSVMELARLKALQRKREGLIQAAHSKLEQIESSNPNRRGSITYYQEEIAKSKRYGDRCAEQLAALAAHKEGYGEFEMIVNGVTYRADKDQKITKKAAIVAASQAIKAAVLPKAGELTEGRYERRYPALITYRGIKADVTLKTEYTQEFDQDALQFQWMTRGVPDIFVSFTCVFGVVETSRSLDTAAEALVDKLDSVERRCDREVTSTKASIQGYLASIEELQRSIATYKETIKVQQQLFDGDRDRLEGLNRKVIAYGFKIRS